MGYINIAPSLPKNWAEGSFTSLRARGNFTVSASWKDYKLT